MPANTTEIEKRLWDAADELRANSKLKSSEYSIPVLGLIFLRYADIKFARAEEELIRIQRAVSDRREISKLDYQARGVMYVPGQADGRNWCACPRVQISANRNFAGEKRQPAAHP